ncbi:MAG: ABC transporter ATP-binding protein [Proteobacteria bacterium]|nr:ABC transporter ATP-binding protein [Pseudomonadota bacterium]
MSILVVKQLHKRFDGIIAVKDLSLAVNKNEIFAIIGPNGAGKTTTFNLISGVLKADGGTVSFKGEPILGLKPHDIAQRGMVRTFQTVNLFDNMSVIDNVKVGCHKNARSEILAAAFRTPGFKAEEARITASSMEALRSIGLAQRAHEMSGNLPFGQQRLLEIARALSGDPEMLLMDEPAAGLNAHETSELASLILKLRDEGITIVIIEHDMELVMEISDCIIVLDQGKKIAEGQPSAIQSNKRVIAAYLGEEC